MGHVAAKDLSLNLVQGGANRIDLGQDVDAVAVVLHHAMESADLTLDAL